MFILRMQMRRNFTITENKRVVLFYSALIFLLQSIAPAFQGVLAKTVDGYTDTLCTMYGPVTVFVKLDDEQNRSRTECFECSVCILQAQLNAEAMAHVLSLDTRYIPVASARAGPLYQVSNPPVYSPFLSRAPPA